MQVLLTPVHLGIVLEYAAGGDMFQHVKRSGGLEEADARWFYQQLMIALDYMHSKSWLQSQSAPGRCHPCPECHYSSSRVHWLPHTDMRAAERRALGCQNWGQHGLAGLPHSLPQLCSSMSAGSSGLKDSICLVQAGCVQHQQQAAEYVAEIPVLQMCCPE